ncbi:pyridoxamine 5'-phosphate oxidase isoform 2 [Galdieria sulphuraria]|uniref:Pyridoxine-5'-phosphate oxidase n=1 Tax=Galdieria sulphuraria TaxID=130081 RepID=M2XQZ4_GALSU|nr:pyridoxamine 5'-phosphate oxidase isoform 1 [Galdieria sulphuraria]XP_005709192.1 pyridoxamine 5'-phosphate oxidase isoform 2 [Galdieria sulphuraria]EME32671.1 pyridoxamine 5'-phosphate oxidase isoform 1 [Galdieria sulphuraria]EME32672.1 pyridoxamine 5'-phosphate oxidase isoform 2 [Galdieria sulphuraria]|eukprot:XP_005709191.1 pyridoxamine 5'-phosphate oxidase isoform 1 [Galdieria sulphuraria]
MFVVSCCYATCCVASRLCLSYNSLTSAPNLFSTKKRCRFPKSHNLCRLQLFRICKACKDPEKEPSDSENWPKPFAVLRLFYEETKREVRRFFLGDIFPVFASDVPKLKEACSMDTFFPIESAVQLDQIEFFGNLRCNPSVALEKIQKRLEATFGDKYVASLHSDGSANTKPSLVITVSLAEKQPQNRFRIVLSVLCTISCILNCIDRSVLYCYHYQWESKNIFMRYCIHWQVFGLLLLHLTWVGVQSRVAKHYNTRMEFPFPIPSHRFGLWGTISHMLSSAPNRTALFDIASIGIGIVLLLSLIVFLVGLHLTRVCPQYSTYFPTNILFSSLFTGVLSRLFKQQDLIASGSGYRLVKIHPLAVLGTNALLIIGCHLLPLRNLDGYRIVASLYGRYVADIASRITILTVLLRLFGSPPLIVFVLMIWLGPWKTDKYARNEYTNLICNLVNDVADVGAYSSVSTKYLAVGPTWSLFAVHAIQMKICCRLLCWIELSSSWQGRRLESRKDCYLALQKNTPGSRRLSHFRLRKQRLPVTCLNLHNSSCSEKLSNMPPTVASLREEYSSTGLDESTLTEDPFTLFRQWLEEAVAAQVREPNAMCLATVDQSGRPSNRYVLLKGFDNRGFVWYTNYTSRKAQHLESNPFAALTFWWGDLERSVRVEGKVFKVSSSESDSYFVSRPVKSRLAAIVSEQSKPVSSRSELEKKFQDLALYYGLQTDGTCSESIPRPETWGGYRLVPDSIEFWKGMRDRLHDRIKYVREVDWSSDNELKNSLWQRYRLQP